MIEDRTAAPESPPRGFEPPEPGLTAETVIRRAQELRPMLREEQEETERRGHYSVEMHQRFRAAGLTRMIQPARFGGYEFELVDYFKAMVEVARGCPSTGWCLTLGSGHVLQLASMFEERTQEEFFGPDGDYIAPMSAVFDPTNTVTPVDGGYRVNGTWRFCSGIPHATHFTGTLPHPSAPAGSPPSLLLVAVPRGGYEMLDDWGGLIGLKGSGSNSVRLEDAFVPEHRTVTMSLPEDVSKGTVGYEIHANPLYAVPFTPFATAELLACVIGMGYAMLDEWEEVVARRPAKAPPAAGLDGAPPAPRLRYEDPDFQRIYGTAVAGIDSAYALLVHTAEQQVELTRRALAGGEAFDSDRIQRIYGQQMTGWELVWRASIDLFRTASSRGAMDGTRIQRYWRDICAFRSNGVHQFDMRAPAAAQAHFDLPITAF